LTSNQLPSFIVHGGAWDIPAEAIPECREGIFIGLEAGWRVLSGGGSALDAVEAAIVQLEEAPAFDAGIGSHLNRDGRVQLDAIVMNGASLKSGAVAAVERVRNPIRLARAVLEKSDHMMIVGAGAEQFAVEQGLPLCSPEELILERERIAWRRCSADSHATEFHFGHRHGTVGAVALDREGRLFAGTSTGGTCCKFPGRVGDSPLIGCGCYADEQAGGVSSTGWGEAIMKIVMAKMAADLLRAGYSAEASAQDSIRHLAQRAHGTGGLILLDRNGRPGFAWNTGSMAFGYVRSDASFHIAP
jgi:beta-aspartyl-peptidase (threonine type)